VKEAGKWRTTLGSRQQSCLVGRWSNLLCLCLPPQFRCRMPNPCSQSTAVKTSVAFAGKKVTVKQISRLNIYGLETQVLPTVPNFGCAVWSWRDPKQQAACGSGRVTQGNAADSLFSLPDQECQRCPRLVRLQGWSLATAVHGSIPRAHGLLFPPIDSQALLGAFHGCSPLAL